jgi:hypothetical protein
MLRLRLELMQQDRIALAVQTHRHPTDRAVDDIAFEGNALAFQLGHESQFETGAEFAITLAPPASDARPSGTLFGSLLRQS